MAYQITSESYGRRLPKITATADSTDDLSTLGTDWAEGSTCVIGSTTYSLDKVQGWVEPGSGGGGGGAFIVNFTPDPDDPEAVIQDKTFSEIKDAIIGGSNVIARTGEENDWKYLYLEQAYISDEGSSIYFRQPAVITASGVRSMVIVMSEDASTRSIARYPSEN